MNPFFEAGKSVAALAVPRFTSCAERVEFCTDIITGQESSLLGNTRRKVRDFFSSVFFLFFFFFFLSQQRSDFFAICFRALRLVRQPVLLVGNQFPS